MDEALSRHHEVTVVARHPNKFEITADNLKVVEGNATDADSIAEKIGGNDVVISVVG